MCLMSWAHRCSQEILSRLLRVAGPLRALNSSLPRLNLTTSSCHGSIRIFHLPSHAEHPMRRCVGSSSSAGGLSEMVGGSPGSIVTKPSALGKICQHREGSNQYAN